MAKTPTLFVLGDSISIHYGPSLERFCRPFRYSRKSGEESFLAPDDRDGENGGDSSRVLSYLERFQESDQSPFDVVLLNCGLHDIKTNPATGDKQVPVAQYEGNLLRIADIGKSIARRLLWVRSTPVADAIHNHSGMDFFRYADDLDAYNSIADRVMTDSGVPVIDLHAFTLAIAPVEELFIDHVHFVEPVRQLQGAYIAGIVMCQTW